MTISLRIWEAFFFGNQPKTAFAIEKHHTYHITVPPSSGLIGLGVMKEIEQDDLVFQVGVRNHTPGVS